MIKVNLLDRKKPAKLPSIGGIDLAQVKPVPFIMAYLFYYIVGDFVVPFINKDITGPEKQEKALQAESRRLNKELRANASLQEKISAFDNQIQNLKKREKQVEDIMTQRSNPKEVFEAFTNIIPEDLWFDELEIKDTDKIYLKGGAISYPSLSLFLDKANNLTYFKGSLRAKNTQTQSVDIHGKKVRASTFEYEGKITSFGDW